MRRAFTVVLAALPFDARGRRALDETLLDWANEEDRAARTRVRLTLAVRYISAIALVVGHSAVGEVRGVPAGRLALQACLGGLPLALAWSALAAFVVGIFGVNPWPMALATAGVGMAYQFPAVIPVLLLRRKAGASLPPMGMAAFAGLLTLTVGLGVDVVQTSQASRFVDVLTSDAGVRIMRERGMPDALVARLQADVAATDLPSVGTLVLVDVGWAVQASALALVAGVIGRARRRSAHPAWWLLPLAYTAGMVALSAATSLLIVAWSAALASAVLAVMVLRRRQLAAVS